MRMSREMERTSGNGYLAYSSACAAAVISWQADRIVRTRLKPHRSQASTIGDDGRPNTVTMHSCSLGASLTERSKALTTLFATLGRRSADVVFVMCQRRPTSVGFRTVLGRKPADWSRDQETTLQLPRDRQTNSSFRSSISGGDEGSRQDDVGVHKPIANSGQVPNPNRIAILLSLPSAVPRHAGIHVWPK